jgi:N-acetylneuraminic acid mutarotase
MPLLMNNAMKSKVKIVFCMLAMVVLGSCTSAEDDDTSTIGDWARTTPFKGRPRSGAIMFTVGSRAFVGLGYDGDDYIGDFYEYNAANGYWEARKSFPGTFRERGVSFSVDGVGYVGLGYNREEDTEELKDFWKYDPDLDEWTQVADFGGTARYNTVAFVVGSNAFVGTGYDGDQYNSDFWKFDPAANAWNEIESYPGDKIESGLSFVIDNKGYVCSGRNNDTYNLDFWSYSPGNETWENLTPDSDESWYDEFKLAAYRHDAVAFTVGGKAYIAGGISSSGATDRSVYEFNPATMKWDDRTSFEGAPRSAAVAFVLDDQAFVGTGLNGTRTYDDIWKFYPDEEYDSDY